MFYSALSPGPTVRLCPRLRLGCLRLRRRPCLPSSMGSHFDPDTPPSSRRRWYAPGCRRLRIYLLGSYFTAATQPATVRTPGIVFPSGVSSEGPIGPVDTVPIQRATHAASSFTGCVLARRTFERQRSRRSLEDTHIDRN